MPASVTIGNFDGVHAGHCELIRRTVAIAREHGWRAVALTFDPHPARVIAPDRAPRIMTSMDQRMSTMEAEGIDDIVTLNFTTAMALLSPEDFVRVILVGQLEAGAVVVGEDFRFGHKHEGDAKLLSSLGQELDFITEFVPAVESRGARVSSTRIRALVEAGQVGLACRLLTRPFALEGPVVSGYGIGRTQTVPTLNLKPDFEVLPKNGVYVTKTNGQNSVTNVGTRPTFEGDALTIETYILGQLAETPEEIKIDFHARIRGERKFVTPEALKSRILQDVKSANRYFSILSRASERD